MSAAVLAAALLASVLPVGADATLGRVLEATTDARLLYLAWPFLGSLEEKAGRTAAGTGSASG